MLRVDTTISGSDMSNVKQKNEIRESQIRELLNKVERRNFGKYLKRVKINKARAFENQIVEFDFPVTALIGTNGGGKTTILGASAIAYKNIKPRVFFPKSSIGDNSMSNWSMTYELIDKEKNPTQVISRTAKFKNSRWDRNDVLDRNVLHFGIMRTVPASERTEFQRLGRANYKFKGQPSSLEEEVKTQVEKILGKDVSLFQRATIDNKQTFYIGGNSKASYSEFHFGAGESSIIRMVSEIEAAEKNTLVLIEEIENGLHPVAVKRMVEYLIDVASRKSIQTIFTTHSEDALSPLPDRAIWSAIDGHARQGHISIASLRAITGRIDERAAIFVEDHFAKMWVEALLRYTVPEKFDEIGVYLVSGDSKALQIHTAHRQNPAVNEKLLSICVLDGDSPQEENWDSGVFKLPGNMPESEVFDYVRKNISTLAMRLAVGMHLPTKDDALVAMAVEEVGRTNRDPHVIFSQIGGKCRLIPTDTVASAFISLWIHENTTHVNRFKQFINSIMTSADEI